MGAAVSVGAVAVVEGRTEPVPGHLYALGHAGRDGAFFCLSRRAAAAGFGFVLFVVDGGIFVLQKAVFPGAGFAAANLWLLLRGRVRFADCAAASAAALAVLAAAAAYFWHEDALKQWFDYNFLFNRQVAAYYGNYTSGVGTALKLCAAGTAAAVIRFCRCGEKETAWLLLLAGCSGILFVFAPHPRYYVPYFLLAAPYVGRAAMRLMAAERLSGRLKKAAIAAAAVGFAVSLWTLVPAGKKHPPLKSIWRWWNM